MADPAHRSQVTWHSVFVVALAMLGVRVVMMAWSARRGELAWSRLLLPAIILLEGVGLASRGVWVPWQLRLATVLALEVGFVVIAIRELRRSRARSGPFEERLARAFGSLIPTRLARFAAFELMIIGSGLRFVAGGWRRAIPPGFTYHRESGLRMLLPLLPLLALGDILLLELVILPHAALWLRIVLHAVALYGLIWLVGIYASLRARPHQLVGDQLTLHRGLLRRLDLNVSDIASIAPLPSFADDWKKRAYLRGALRLDFAGPTILELKLHAPARAVGVLGEGRPGTRVLVAVDDPAALAMALRYPPG